MRRAGCAFLIVILIIVFLATVAPQIFVSPCTPTTYQKGDRVRVRKLPTGKYDVFDGSRRDRLADKVRSNRTFDPQKDTYWGLDVGWEEGTDTYIFDLEPTTP